MRLMPWSWAIGVVLVWVALGWQLVNELGVRQCVRDLDGLTAMQCGGWLDAWVLPVTLLAALMLVAIGIWRLVPPPRPPAP